MYHLSKELQEHLKVIDPYMVLKEEMEIFGFKMNTMIRLRKESDLGPKQKGRPKDRDVLTPIEYTPEVQKSIEAIKEIRAKEIKILEDRRRGK